MALVRAALYVPPRLRCRCYVVHCCNVQSESTRNRKGVVFLGTPAVAADVLDSLLDAARSQNSMFEVLAVVTQPPSIRGRERKPMPSPVAQRAMEKNFPAASIFSPEKAGEEAFLGCLKYIKPDLCLTAAYGNILPQKFLDIPHCGTVNIHPSLLPLYRGAAPVQRALQDGVQFTGVTLAYTVRALDSGPIIASERVEIDSDVKAPELQAMLFAKGTSLLLENLPSILDKTAVRKAKEQDNSLATFAPKISVEECWLCFDETASFLHNKVRAFAEWPGTKARFLLHSDNVVQQLEVKIVTTKIGVNLNNSCTKDVKLDDTGNLLVYCGDNTLLKIVELQPPGKRIMAARDFWNGIRRGQLQRM